MARRGAALLILLLMGLVGPAAGDDAQAVEQVYIGVLALRGMERAEARWAPTVAYLQGRLPDTRVHLVPLDFDQVEAAVRERQIDFLLANPAFYVRFEASHGLERLATLRNRSTLGPQTYFASTILRRSERRDLAEFADLRGQRIGAVDAESLGGYLMALGTLLDHGIDLRESPRQVRFLGTHDAVVYAVLSGEVDAGIVRSDTLERMADEGRIALAEISVMQPVAGLRFPFLRSTGLFPEWPLAKLPHVSPEVGKRVATALLMMPEDHPAAVAGRHAGWDVAKNYAPVHRLLRQLELPPYVRPRPSLAELLRRHPLTVVSAVAILLLSLAYAMHARHSNRRLRATTRELERSLHAESETLQRLEGLIRDRDHSEHRFQKLANASMDGIVLLDATDKVTFANAAAAELLGYSRDQLLSKPFHSMVVPDTLRAQAESGLRQFGIDGSGSVIDRRVDVTAVRNDGTRIDVELSVSAMEEQGGWYAIGIFRDVTESRQIVHALQESQDNFRNIVEKNQTGILLINTDGTIRFANPAAGEMLRRDPASLVGTAFGIPASTDIRSEINVLRADGSLGVAETLFTHTEWNGDKAYLVMLHDVTPYHEAQAQIKHMAFTDHLTGLPNRMRMLQELGQAVTRARRAGSRFALLYLDLNRFKQVNDTLGHAVGDKLLVEVAARLSASVRASDLVARMGGDEFTVLLQDVARRAAITEVAEKIAEHIRGPISIDGNELFISASIGSTLYPDNAADPAEMLKQADTAMYRAKREGREFAEYQVEMSEAVRRLAVLDRDLHRAVDNAQFVVYYQPQVDLASARTVASEALLRWRHPKHGMVSPAEFIPALENGGLIVEVGRWVIDEVCRQLAAWRDAGDVEVLPVAVNLSPIQLERDNLLEFIRDRLAHYRIPPAWLVLEITESTLLADSVETIPQLHELARFGIDLHIDDFGTGYSSLSLIKRLPLTTVKIDQSFVRDLAKDPADLALTQAAITMAHGLGKTALAEGVETQEHVEILRRLGCDFAQGYLFSRPVPVEQLVLPPRVRTAGLAG